VGPPESSGQRRWVWPLAAIGAIALLWALLGRDRSPQPVAVAIDSAVMSALGADSTLAPAALTLDTAAGLVARTVRDLGTIAKRTLPTGVVLNVTERGIESSLIAFIDDSSRPVNRTTWFEFDRLNFATSSATILPESQEQLGNIAAILDAYPNVTVKIGGYTDNSGDRAANKRLSQQRAQSVRRALIDNGIAPSRMVAEGYGDAHPVADNASADGRARNRRIAVRVTSK
jgi:OmpA-OmpF porin, OOP family